MLEITSTHWGLKHTLTSKKVYFLQKKTEEIATNQHNASARLISEEAQKLLVNVVKMATDEEKWAKVDELFKD